MFRRESKIFAYSRKVRVPLTLYQSDSPVTPESLNMVTVVTCNWFQRSAIKTKLNEKFIGPEVFQGDRSSRSQMFFNHSFSSFFPNAPFLYSLKTLKNLRVFWRFQGLEKQRTRNNWVNKVVKVSKVCNICI